MTRVRSAGSSKAGGLLFPLRVVEEPADRHMAIHCHHRNFLVRHLAARFGRACRWIRDARQSIGNTFMRPRRVQFTLRRMMAVIAITALVFWGEATRRTWVNKSMGFRALATAYWQKAVETEQMAHEIVKAAHSEDAPGVASTQQLADYYGALNKKYETAAHRPWVSLPADPPPPPSPKLDQRS